MQALLVLLGGSFVLKLLVLLQLRNHPLLQPDAGLDTTAYVDLARKVLGGETFLGPGLYYVSPLYIYFLASGMAITGSITAVRLFQIALGTASVGFIFLNAREWFGERAAWIAAGLAAITGLFTFYESLILQSSIDAFLTSAALLCLTMALRRGRVPWLLAAGFVFGIQSLNRPNMALAVAGIAAVLLIGRRVWPAALLVGGLLVGMAPAAVRNLLVANQWSFVSSHGGLNFYIGNSETATGFYQQIPGISPTIGGQEKDARRVAERAVGRSLTEAETSDYFFGRAWRWIREQPAAAIALFARKLFYVFSAHHIALPHSYPFYAYDADTMLRFYPVGPWLLVPLGLVGLVFAAPSTNRSDYLVWVSFVPAYAVAVAAFFVAERYRLPLLVPLCIGAGAAIDAAMRAVIARRAAALVVPGVVVAALFVLANWRLPLHDGRWEEGLRLAQRLVILGRYDEAEQWLRAIEPREPRPGATEYGVGAQLLVGNQTDRAIAHLTRAQQRDPGQPNVEYALGQALLKAGQAKNAVPHLRRGFDAGVELPMGGYDLAVALLAVGDDAGAAGVIRRIRPADEDDPEAWLRLGRLATEAQAPDAAEPFFRRAAQMRPDQASARQQLGLNLLVLGRLDEAARELAEAARLDPQDPDSLSRLAYCEFKLGRLADARAHAGAALALNPGDELARQLMAALRR